MRRTLAFASAALAGTLTLALLAPRFDATPLSFKPRLDRTGAIAAASRFAALHGLDISTFRFSVSAQNDSAAQLALRHFPNSPLAPLLAPSRVRVLADDRRGNALLTVLSPSGLVLGFELRGPLAASSSPTSADAEFARFSGPLAPRFTRTASGVFSRDGLRSAWEWLDPAHPALLARIEIVIRDNRLVRASSDSVIAAQTLNDLRTQHQIWRDFFTTGFLILTIFLVPLGLWSLFSSLARRTDHLRFALRLAWIPALPLLLPLLTGAFRNSTLVNSFEQGLTGDLRLLNLSVVTLFLLAAVASTLAAGYAELPRSERHHWIALWLVARFKFFNRPVGREATLGLLSGPALAALPFLAALLSSPAYPGLRLLDEPNTLFERFPALAPLDSLAFAWDLFAVVFFLLPWLAARLPRPALRWPILFAAFTFLAFPLRDAFPGNSPFNPLLAAAFSAGFLLVYRFSGLLGVWLAAFSLHASTLSARLLPLDAASLHASGLIILVCLAALLAAAILAWRRGARDDGAAALADMKAGASALSRSDRERLKAEFAVARRAQQNLLPTHAPSIPGFSLSASCDPAREVGGDLFDIFSFPSSSDPLWGLCVADVSGKGVPASIFMTLTKGMLAAARLSPPDLHLIASRINRAFTAAGHHRVFITMSLALLDPARARLRHIRAGHNPPLLFRHASSEISFLKPHGIGIGLTQGPAFARNLETESIALHPGDTVVFYSDGLVECMNEDQHQYGEDRLAATVSRLLSSPSPACADSLRQAIVDDARSFRGQADPHDDLTVLVLQANPQPPSTPLP